MVLCVACVDTFDYNYEGEALCIVGGFKGDFFHLVCVICDVGVEKNAVKGETLGHNDFPCHQ